MATKTEEIARIQAELDIVRSALQTIPESGQSVSIGDITYTEVNYNALVAREESLSRELARVNGSRPRVLHVNMGSMYR